MWLFSAAQTDAQLVAPDQGGLHIASVSSVDTTKPVSLVVNSQDYGGSAILKPKAIIAGDTVVGSPVTLPFDVVDTSNNEVTPPSCADADAFAKKPFASLPVDQDCDGIADSWEQQNGFALGGADPTKDYASDGLSLFDKYRGFHMINPTKPTTQDPLWMPTNPQMQDLFYWDSNNFILYTDKNGNPSSHLANVFGAQTQGKITLHAVNGEEANATDPDDPEAKLKALNSNSPYVDTNEAFAIAYVNSNQSQNQNQNAANGDATNDVDLGVSCDPGTSPANQSAWATCFRNDGPQPIHIYVANINSRAGYYWSGDPTDYESVLLDQVLAHETGHKMGLLHHQRRVTLPNPPLTKTQMNNLSTSLQFGNFVEQKVRAEDRDYDIWQVTIEEYVYKLTEPPFKHRWLMKQEQPSQSAPGEPCTTPAGIIFDDQHPTPSPAYPRNATPVYWPIMIPVDGDIPPASFIMDSQDGEIMSYTPELDNTEDSDWSFGNDLGSMCLEPEGCGSPLPGLGCSQSASEVEP